MDYKEFFTKDNTSGIKTKESYLVKHEPKLYSNILNYLEDSWYIELPFKEKVWYFINNIKIRVSCLGCGIDVKFKGNLNKGYNKYCSLSCANDSGHLVQLAKKSTLVKYGVDSTNKLESVKNKKKQTYINNYGVDNPMKDDLVKSKYKESIINNYGVDNPMKDDNIKNKLIKNIQLKYKVNNIFELPETKNKIKKK